MAAITATSTSNTDFSVSPDVRPFPAPYLTPAGTTTSADFCPVSSRLTAGAVGAATPQHNRHPGRPPRIRTTTFPYAHRVYVTTPSVVTGLTFLSRLTQIVLPCTRFVFPGAGFRLGLPSYPASRRRSCLRLGVSTTSSSRGLSPPSTRPRRAAPRDSPDQHCPFATHRSRRSRRPGQSFCCARSSRWSPISPRGEPGRARTHSSRAWCDHRWPGN